MYGEAHGANARASKWHWKLEPIWFEANLKVGVASLMRPPFGGPEVILATLGGIVSAVKLLEGRFIAGFAVWSKREQPGAAAEAAHRAGAAGVPPVVPEHVLDVPGVRWLRIILKAPFSIVA